MSQPVDLRPDHLKIVHDILSECLPAGVFVRVFGSRAKWTAKTHSDLDLALRGKERLPETVVAELAEAFSESDLPFNVDVVDWHGVSPSFQSVIDRDGRPLGWMQAPLEQCLDALIDYRGKSPPKSPDGIPVLSAKVVKTDGLVQPIEQKIAPDFYATWMTRGFPQPGDVVMTTEAPLGEVIQLDDETARYALGQRIVCMRGKAGHLDNRFLRYRLISPEQQKILKQYQTGTTVLGISQKSLRQMPISFPAYREQKRIGDLLGTLDDKIELNRRMNEMLEAQARALFRDWFVDFGPVKARMAGAAPYLAPDLWSLFPDHFGDDGVPEGWRTFRVDELAHHHTRTLTPMNAPSELFEHFSLPAFDSGQQPVLEPGAGIKSNKTIVPEGAILLSKLNPEIPRVWWPNARGEHRQIASTEFLTFTPIEGFPQCLLYSLFSDDAFRQRLEGMVTGTSKSHQRVNPKALRALDALVGEERIISAFGQLCSPVMAKVLANRAEVMTLSHARDLLLPKLMSGEIRVGEAERQLEDVP
jgi:type I restriction enzyme, S subunit